MTKINEGEIVETQKKSPEKKSGILKGAMVATALLATSVQAGQLLKTDPIVVAKCDKNGDSKIKGKEYLCFLDMKKQKAQEGLQKAQEGLQKAQEGLQKEQEGLQKEQDGLQNAQDEKEKLEKQILKNIKIAQK